MATVSENLKFLREMAKLQKKKSTKEKKKKDMTINTVRMFREMGSQPYKTFDNKSIDDIRQKETDRKNKIQLDSIRMIREGGLTKNLYDKKQWSNIKAPAKIALNDYPEIKNFRDTVVNSSRKTFTQNEIDFYNRNKHVLPKNYDIDKYARDSSQRLYEKELSSVPIIGKGLEKIAQAANVVNTPFNAIADIIQGKAGERIDVAYKATVGGDLPSNYYQPDLGSNAKNTAADLVGSILGYITPTPGSAVSLGSAGLQAGQGMLGKFGTTKGGQILSKNLVKLDKTVANKLPNIIKNKYPQVVKTVRDWAAEGIVSSIPISGLESLVQNLDIDEATKKIVFDSLLGAGLDIGVRGAGKAIPGLGKGILNKTGIADELKFGESADISGRGIDAEYPKKTYKIGTTKNKYREVDYNINNAEIKFDSEITRIPDKKLKLLPRSESGGYFGKQDNIIRKLKEKTPDYSDMKIEGFTEQKRPDSFLELTKKLNIKKVKSKYKLKNKELKKAWNEYDEAIETIQNHYGTNELRQSEVNSIKDDLGIDLNEKIRNIEKAEKITIKDVAERERIKRIAGLEDSKIEKIRRIASGKEKVKKLIKQPELKPEDITIPKSEKLTNKYSTNKMKKIQELKRPEYKIEKYNKVNKFQEVVGDIKEIKRPGQQADYSKKAFDVRYGLDKDISKYSAKAKAEYEKKTIDKMLEDSGKRISKKVESYLPENIVKYYKGKYKLPDDIKVDDTLQGSKNYAELTYKKDNKGNLKDFTIKYNKNIDNNDILLGSIRHEIEHYRDVKSGYESPKDFIPNQKSNTLSEMYKGGKHNKYYDWFEPEYLRRSEIKESLSRGENIDDAILNELNIDSSKIKKTGEISEQNLKGENIPDEKIKPIQNDIDSIKKKMSQKNISQEELEMLQNKLNEKYETKREFLRTSLDSSKELSNKIINTPDVNYSIKPVKGSLKNRLKNRFEMIYSELMDDFHPLRGSKITKTKSEQRLKDLALKTQKEASNYKKYNGTVYHIVQDSLVDPNGNVVGDSLSKIMNRPDNDIFTKYLVYQTHVNRMKKKSPQPSLYDINGKPVSIEESLKVIKEIEEAIPDIKESASDLYSYNDKLYENWLYDFISPENFKKMKKLDPKWVPIMRDIKIDPSSYQSGVLSNKPIKFAIGGNQPIIDLNQAMPIMTQRVIRANRKNAIYKAMFENALTNPEASKYYTIKKINGESLGEDALEQLKKFQNIDIDGIEKIDDNLIDTTKGRFVVSMIDAKPNVLQIHDNNIWTALKKLNHTDVSSIDTVLKISRSITNKFKAPITTYNPVTATRGIFKDLPDSYIYSAENRPDKFAIETLKSIKEMLANDKMYKKYQAVGGGGQGLSAIEKSLTPNKMDRALYKVNYYNNATETLARYTEFKNVYRKTLKSSASETDAIRNALYASDNITVNFSRSGRVGKAVDSFVPYLNPAMQGLDKHARDFFIKPALNKNPAPLLKAIGAVTIPTFIFHSINMTNENYRNLPDYEKDNYYCWFYNNKDYIRIPKTRETSLIFSAFFDRTLRKIEGDEKAYDGLVKHFVQVGLPMNPVEGHLLMGREYIQRNKDHFEREIVPQYMLEYSPKNQYDENTSELAKKLGSLPVVNKTGKVIFGKEIGPKQIDFLTNQYLNVYWKIYAASERFITGKSEESFKDNFMRVTGFGANSEYKSKQSSEFYKEMDSVNTKIKDIEKENGIYEIRANTKSSKLENIKIKNVLGAKEYKIYENLKKLRKDMSKIGDKASDYKNNNENDKANEEYKKIKEKLEKLKLLKIN